MALIDFRVQPGFFHHPKIVALREACGEHAVLCILQLWAHAAENAPDGNLHAMSDAMIEIAAGWMGSACEMGKFVAQLRKPDAVLLDGNQLHDWQEHQPFLCGRKERSKKARHAARMRWACSSDAKTEKGNAPSPLPLPSPSPSPLPLPAELPVVDNSKLTDEEFGWITETLRLVAGSTDPFGLLGSLHVRGYTNDRAIMWALYRLQIRRYDRTLEKVREPVGYLYDMLDKMGDRPVSISQGGDNNYFREELSIKDWYKKIFPAPGESGSTVRGGGFKPLGQLLPGEEK
jgi:hypothetical protein